MSNYQTMSRPSIIAAVIIITATILGYASVWNDAPIVDEIPHIGAGYSYVAKGDMRLNPEHPPLVKDLAGVALVLLGINDQAFLSHFWTTNINGQWDFGRQLIYQAGNNADMLVRAAKIPIFIFFVLTAIILYRWASRYYDERVALLTLFLYAFSPTIIAHSRFITTDMAALFGVVAATYFLLRYFESPSKESFLIAGLIFGAAQLTKFSLVLLIPYFLILALAHGIKNGAIVKKAASTIGVMAIGYVVVVWPVYTFHVINYPPERQIRDSRSILASHPSPTLVKINEWAAGHALTRPMAQYGLGLLMVNQRASGGNTTYFLGEVTSTAWKKYFPIVYFIKEPLPFWILVIGALVSTILLWQKNRNKNNFHEYAMLIWIIIYWAVSIRANLNIGVRHMLPVYGFTYLLVASRVVQIKDLFYRYRKALTGVMAAILAWYAYENVSVFPYYLTYFNQTVGGPSSGYRYVVDSNLDWGQDLKRLNDWVRANNIPKIYVDYFGWADPAYYLRERFAWLTAGQFNSKEDFLRFNPQGGYLAVSATFYMNSRQNPATSYEWLDEYKPMAVIGNSIFVWRLTP